MSNVKGSKHKNITDWTPEMEAARIKNIKEHYKQRVVKYKLKEEEYKLFGDKFYNVYPVTFTQLNHLAESAKELRFNIEVIKYAPSKFKEALNDMIKDCITPHKIYNDLQVYDHSFLKV